MPVVVDDQLARKKEMLNALVAFLINKIYLINISLQYYKQ